MKWDNRYGYYPKIEIPKQKVKDLRYRIKSLTNRSTLTWSLERMLGELNPMTRGWGNYYCKAHVRLLFNQLDRWIVRRIWSHKCKHWRNTGWKSLSLSCLYGQMGLVNLIALIPSLASARRG